MAGFEAKVCQMKHCHRSAARGRDGCRRVLDLIAWNWILVRPLFCFWGWNDVEEYSYAWV